MTTALDYMRNHSRTFMALLRKDLKGYFDQPTGYILLVIFVAVVSWFHFRDTISQNEASLRVLFEVMPFVLAIFVPAATMRLLSEEQRDGTLELLLTQPLRTWTVLGAKFTAGLVFVSVGIMLTIGIPILMETAGDIDAGASASQYIGAILLSASFVGVGLFTSSLTQNQIVAFMLALFLNAVLIIIGLSFLTLTLPSAAAVLLEDLSPYTHFGNIARGVIGLRDLIYFAAITILFLSGAYLMLRGRTLSHRTQLYKNLRLGVAGLVLASILAGWFGSSIGGRWDLTDDSLFTLSPATKELVNDLDDILTINFFASNDPPVQIAGAIRDVENFLRDLEATSDLVRLVKHEPDKDDKARAKAELVGVDPVQFNIQSQDELQIKNGYLGLTLSYIDQREVIRVLDSIEGLEYRVATLANKMVRRNKQTVGFLTGHGEKDRATEMRILDFQIGEQYNLLDVRADSEGNLDLSGIDVIVIAGPTLPISAGEAAQLDEFFASGGSGLILIDPSLPDRQRFVLRTNENNFVDFTTRYGVFVHTNLVIDVGSSETLSFSTPTGSVLLPYPYWIKAPVLSSERDISGTTESIMLPWAASIEEDRPEITAVDSIIPLVESTETGILLFQHSNIQPLDKISAYPIEGLEQGKQLMAVAVSGRAATAAEDDASFRMIVVGNSEWAADEIASRAEGNIVLALNWIDWLAQEDALASIRSKIVTSRELNFSSDTHRDTVQYVNIAGVPALLVLLGAFRFWRRRQFTQRSYEASGQPNGGQLGEDRSEQS